MIKQFEVPALPEVTLISLSVQAAVEANESAQSALEKATAKAMGTALSVTDAFEADGWRSEFMAKPASKEAAETVIQFGDKSATWAEWHNDLTAFAIVMIDRKLKADAEPDANGVQWTKAVKQYHLRTATLPKAVNDSMTVEEKARRKSLRQEIGSYRAAFKRDLANREAKHRAALDPTGKANEEANTASRQPHQKRSKQVIAVEKVNWVIKVAQDSETEILKPTEVVKAAKVLLALLTG